MDLRILSTFFHDILDDWSTITKGFQAFIVLFAPTSHYSFSYTISYIRLKNYRKDITWNITEPTVVSVPNRVCPLTSPVILCHAHLQVPKDEFIRLSVLEMVHNAPDDTECHFFGLLRTDFPQHRVAEWFKNEASIHNLPTPRNESHYISEDDLLHYVDTLDEIYTQNTVCSVITSQDTDGEGMNLYSSGHRVLLTVYGYTTFMSVEPKIVIRIESSQFQMLSLHTSESSSHSTGK